jgi:ribosomal protein S18 acetylase RimI-like enzyme
VTYRIEQHRGSREELVASFREAEDSDELLSTYLELGQVWVARDAGGEVVGHLQAVERDGGDWEVTNTAVREDQRGRGIGRALLQEAVTAARTAGVRRVVLATAAADVGALRFYQRCGFRMTHVVRDVFTPARGYPEGLDVDGIPLLDQVWFDLEL